MRKTKKLGAEIAANLRAHGKHKYADMFSPRTKSRVHHSSRLPADEWDVAMDALLEHDSARAADIVLGIKRDHGLATMTPAFSKALGKVPEDVRRRFEGWAGVVSKKSYDWSSFADGATNAVWGDAYASEIGNLEYDETRRALSPSPGGRWIDVLPDPPAAVRILGKKFAKTLREQITDIQLNEVAAKLSAEKAGYSLMQSSQGYGDEAIVDIPLPVNVDLRGYDLKLNAAVWKAIVRKAREAQVPL